VIEAAVIEAISKWTIHTRMRQQYYITTSVSVSCCIHHKVCLAELIWLTY